MPYPYLAPVAYYLLSWLVCNHKSTLLLKGKKQDAILSIMIPSFKKFPTKMDVLLLEFSSDDPFLSMV